MEADHAHEPRNAAALMSTPLMPAPSGVISPTPPWLGYVGVEWTVKKSPSMETTIQRARTGRESRTIYQSRPDWKFAFIFNVLRDNSALARNVAKSYPLNEFETLVSFFLGRSAQGLPFFFKDPTDYIITDQSINPATTAGQTDFQMVRSFGNGGYVEPVFGIDTTASCVVKIDGSTVTTYTKNVPYDGWIRFTGAAATTLASGSHAITASYTYLFKARFEKNILDFTTTNLDLWEARTVGLVSVWP